MTDPKPTLPQAWKLEQRLREAAEQIGAAFADTATWCAFGCPRWQDTLLEGADALATNAARFLECVGDIVAAAKELDTTHLAHIADLERKLAEEQELRVQYAEDAKRNLRDRDACEGRIAELERERDMIA